MAKTATLTPEEAIPATARGKAAAPIGALRRGRVARIDPVTAKLAAPIRASTDLKIAAPLVPREDSKRETIDVRAIAGRIQVAIGVTLLVVALMMGLLMEPLWHGGRSILPSGVVRMVQAIPGVGSWFSGALRGPMTAQAQQTLPPAPVSPDDLLPESLLDLTPDQARRMNTAMPISSVKSAIAQPFVIPLTDLDNRRRAVQCMTTAIYYEAAQEPDAGQRAVAQVILNRMRHPAYPKTVCGVIFQGSERATGCQFTFSCDGSLRRVPDPALWRRAQTAAEASLNGWVERSVGLATHYHANYVVPRWANTLVKTSVIGAHIFYRWTGGWGTPAAFTGAWAAAEPLIPNLPAIEGNPAAEIVLASAEPAPVPVVAPSATVAAEPVAVIAPVAPPPAVKAAEPAATPAAPPAPVFIAPIPGAKPTPAPVAPKQPGSRPRLPVPSNW